MRVLAISSAYGGAEAAVVCDGRFLAMDKFGDSQGLAAALPAVVSGVLAKTGDIDLVAVVVGPGSFTGLRAGISIACGVAFGRAVGAVGVTVAEALAEEASGTEMGSRALLGDRQLWTAVGARRQRVFIGIGGDVRGYATDALPRATGRIAVCGDAANLVAATLAACGTDVMLTPLRTPGLRHVAAVALRRAAGGLPPLAVVPLYVDAPEAKVQASSLRAPPA